MAFPKNRRIKLEKDFERIFKSGRTLRHPLFLLKFLNSPLDYCRVAVSVPIAISKKAVVRNKLKRTFWSALEEIFPRCRSGVDLVIVASSVAVKKNFLQVVASLEEIFVKANIVKVK